jgi:hypothetical protein
LQLLPSIHVGSEGCTGYCPLSQGFVWKAYQDYLLSPGLKTFTSILRAATKGFIEAIHSFSTQYTTWSVPDRLNLPTLIQNALFSLQDAYANPVEYSPTLHEVIIQTNKLMLKLTEIANKEELTVFIAVLVWMIKDAMMNLHFLLGETNNIFTSVLICGAIEHQKTPVYDQPLETRLWWMSLRLSSALLGVTHLP